MSDYFLYFRCWPDIIAGFPVEEFNSLRNDEIEPALNRFALDWLRSHRVEVRKLVKQRLVEQKEVIKRRRGVTASRPDGKWGPRPQRSKPRPSVRTHRSPRKSLFRRVGDYAGWFVQNSMIFEDKESGEVKSAGPLVAVYHTSDQGFAEKVVSILNCDWSEYESGYPRRDYDPTSGALGKPLFHLETELNPRFGLLHARDASKERFRLMMLQVANVKKNEPPDVLHPDLHLAIAQRTMRVINEMEAAWRPSKPPNKKKRQRRKPDPKVAERRAERAEQAKIDREIFADWRKDTWREYQNYVDLKNENLPDGWPKLDRSYVEYAIGREKARLKRLNKWPPE